MRPVAPWAWSLACEPLPIRSGGTLKGEDRWVPALLFGLRLSVVRVSRSFANARAADPCAQAQAPRRNRQNARQIDLSEAGRGEPAAGVITAQRQWPAALEAGERSAWTVFPRRPPLVLINLHDRAIRCKHSCDGFRKSAPLLFHRIDCPATTRKRCLYERATAKTEFSLPRERSSARPGPRRGSALGRSRPRT